MSAAKKGSGQTGSVDGEFTLTKCLPLALAVGLPWLFSAVEGRSEPFLTLARARRQAVLSRLLGPPPREVKNPHAPFLSIGPRYPWHRNITSSVFWVGEGTVSGGGVSNCESAFNAHWLGLVRRRG
jgi:hypothetical protein